MSPRTSWDAPASEGRQADVERYRRERATALKKMGERAKTRGRRRPGGVHRPGDYRSPDERAEQADYIHEESFKPERDLNLSRMDMRIESSEADFSTEDAAEALARRKRQKKLHGNKLARGD